MTQLRLQDAPRWLHALAFALLLALAFPFRAGALRFDVGLVAGWLALVPFVWMLRDLTPRAAFRWGLLSGTAAYCGVLFWIVVVVTVFGNAPAAIGVLATALLAAYVGLHVGLAALLYAWLAPGAGRLAVLVLPAAWVVTEHMRTFDLFSGFPWAFLGYAVHGDGPMLELASLGGVWGLSFLLATFAALIARGRASVAIGVLCIAHVVGFVLRVQHLPEPGAPPTSRLRAALVQGNIAQTMKWDPQRAEQNFQVHVETTRLAAADGAELILWPESAVPVFLEAQPRYAEIVENLARETGAVLVVGGIGLTRAGPDDEIRYSNSVFTVTPEQGIVDRYDKTLLVPFGEYVPMRWLLGFVSAIATGTTNTDITPGPAPRTLRNLPPGLGKHAPAALICYEVIYPGLVREAVRDGARVLLNLTNDAWYGHSSAPHQFMAIAAMRSAEHGLPMLRAANTGVSGVVDAGGVVLEQTPIFERWALPVVAPAAREGPTLYTRFGDWVVWFSWLLLIGSGAFKFGGVHLVGRGERKSA